MTSIPLSEQVAERVERLLARHAALQQSHQELTGELATVRQERDALQHRLDQARLRVEALLERLPLPPEESPESMP